MENKYPFLLRITLLLLFLILAFHGIIQAREFLYPIGTALLFTGLLYPIVILLEDWGFNKALAILTSILLGILVLGGIGYLLITQLRVFVEQFDTIQTHAQQNISSIKEFLNTHIGLNLENQPLNANRALNRVLSATTGTLVKIGLQPVYVFFFLFYRKKFSTFLYRLVSEKHHDNLDEIIHEFSLISKSYVGGLFIVVLILCILNTLGLYLIGLKHALLFGILSAALNFIPYFGTLIGASIPLAYAILIDPQRSWYVALFFVAIQFTENNLLTPRITGGHVNINPIMTILGIIIGGMVWGIPGMFLSVPMLAAMKSVFSHIESLKPFAFLLERNSK